jgi:hypothetical protein
MGSVVVLLDTCHIAAYAPSAACRVWSAAGSSTSQAMHHVHSTTCSCMHCMSSATHGTWPTPARMMRRWQAWGRAHALVTCNRKHLAQDGLMVAARCASLYASCASMQGSCPVMAAYSDCAAGMLRMRLLRLPRGAHTSARPKYRISSCYHALKRAADSGRKCQAPAARSLTHAFAGAAGTYWKRLWEGVGSSLTWRMRGSARTGSWPGPPGLSPASAPGYTASRHRSTARTASGSPLLRASTGTSTI